MRICANAIHNYKVFSDSCIKNLLANGLASTEENIGRVIRDYLAHYNIIYHYGEIADRDASMIVVKRKSIGPQKILIIDSRLKKYPKPIRSLHLKRLFLHEIGHCFLNHPATKLDGWKNQFSTTTSSQLSLKQSKEKDQYEYEVEAEICASVIGFWPEHIFRKRVKDFNYDLLRLADSFKFDVDCCAKYLLLRDESFDWHYLKVDVDRHEIEDFVLPEHYDDIFYGIINTKHIFSIDTAITTLIKNHPVNAQKFCIKDTALNSSLKVTCKAFYVEKSPIKELNENDRIIVIGHKC